VSVSLALALIPLVIGRSQGWPVWVWVSLACSAPLMVLTLRWERALDRRGGQPLLELGLFRDPVFVRGLVISVTMCCSFFSVLFALTLVLQAGLGLSPLRAGLTFTSLGLAFAAASIASTRIAARRGARLVTTGAAIAALGMLALLSAAWLSGEHTSVPRIIGPLTLIGLGNGLALPAITGAVLAGARTRQPGAAAGLLTTAQQFAGAAGVAVLGTVFFTALGGGSGVAAYASALAWVAAIDLVLVLVAGGASLLLPRPGRAGTLAAVPPAAAPSAAEPPAA